MPEPVESNSVVEAGGAGPKTGLAEGPSGDIAGATGLNPAVAEEALLLLSFEAEVVELVAARSLLPSRARADELNVPAFVQMSSTLRTFSRCSAGPFSQTSNTILLKIPSSFFKKLP